jgi:predicted component of type VI protein secretion system
LLQQQFSQQAERNIRITRIMVLDRSVAKYGLSGLYSILYQQILTEKLTVAQMVKKSITAYEKKLLWALI